MISLAGYALALAAIGVDGRLDEPQWKAAETLSGFVQIRPGDNAPPSRQTTVLLSWDANALYIGIRAKDDPAKVRATVARRDDVLADDTVTLYLDTFDDHRRAYVLTFNPLGIQQDGIYTEGRGIDYSADLVLESKGTLTADGFTIEAALPLASIRHRSGAGRNWGVHVERRIQHLDEDVSWKPRVRGNANLLAQAGAIHSFGGAASRQMIEVIPAMTVAVDANEQTRDPGLTMKMALASDFVVDATVNPDFAQIEADQLVSSANVRFPIFFEEKRPFFQEGIDVFQTPLNAMHTRTIVDPSYAAKASGKLGRTTFAALIADDDTRAGAIRIKHDIGTESFIGAMATNRDDNQLAGIDGRFTLDANTTATFQLLGTSSDAGSGAGFFAQWQRSGRHLTVTLEGEGRTPDYRANLGFTTQTDTNRWSVRTRYDSEPRPDARLISWTFLHTFFSQWDWDGNIKYAYVYPRVELNFRRQTKLSLFAYTDYLRIFEKEFDRPFLGEPERSTVFKGATVSLATAPSKKISLEITVDHAWDTFDFDLTAPAGQPIDPDTGRSLSITGRIELQPIDSLRITFDHARNRLVRDDSGRVAFDELLYSTQATYQFTAFLFARARVDYAIPTQHTRSQVVLGWTPSPGTSLYAGYTEDFERTVFVKASYLVRREW
jgi:hypothetical protein